MTYRELLALYEKGELPEEMRAKLEADIEKQDAISEYLSREGEIPGLDDLPPLDGGEEGTDPLLPAIQKAIRRAFVKLGVTVGAVVLLVVLCAVFVLPRAVSLFYYDPNRVAGREEGHEDLTTSQMSLDLAVWSEVYLPGRRRDVVIAQPEGYGAYTISIPQTIHNTDGSSRTVNGHLVRGCLTLYDTDPLAGLPGNAFLFHGGRSDLGMGCHGDRDQAVRKLEELPERTVRYAYVTLKEVTDYADFYRWSQGLDLGPRIDWCGLYAEGESGEPVVDNSGFALHPSGILYHYDREKYPALSPFAVEDPASEEQVRAHVLSLMDYLEDHQSIRDLFSDAGSWTPLWLGRDDVEENGVRVYGFGVSATREELLELWDDPAVAYLWTETF